VPLRTREAGKNWNWPASSLRHAASLVIGYNSTKPRSALTLLGTTRYSAFPKLPSVVPSVATQVAGRVDWEAAARVAFPVAFQTTPSVARPVTSPVAQAVAWAVTCSVALPVAPHSAPPVATGIAVPVAPQFAWDVALRIARQAAPRNAPEVVRPAAWPVTHTSARAACATCRSRRQ
jgi:hypothetical protein